MRIILVKDAPSIMNERPDADEDKDSPASSAPSRAPSGSPGASSSRAHELQRLITTRPMATAISIPDEDSSDEEEDPTTLYAASPGASSLVARPESWRPYPPPMLSSSFDSRQVPALHPRVSAGQPSSSSRAPLYGAAVLVAAADVLRQDPSTSTTSLISPHPSRSPSAYPSPVLAQPEVKRVTRRADWRSKLSRAAIQMRTLSRAPRELWLVFVLKLLSSYSYFSLSLILTVYLTDEFGLSDYGAGWAYGTYGVMSTFFGVVCGWFIDYLGVRLALLLGAVIGAIARLIMAFTVSRHVAVVTLYTLLPFAECLGIPIMTIGIKRYTNAHNRTFAFSLFYSMMNVAALVAGPTVDLSRSLFRNGVSWDLRFLGVDHVLHMTGLRIVVLSSAVSTAAICLVVLVGIREIEVDETGSVQDFAPNRDSPLTQTFRVLREAAFWRLTLFTLLLVGVRLVFRHLDATMPKYLIRQFGPDAPYGLIYAINPFLIIILVPFVGLATRGTDSFKMILYGSFIAAASPFWICVAPAYWTVIMFMVTLSIGEAVYSPRVYEYTMEVSGRGNEGLYSSLSSAPLFSVKLVVGGMSGWLLTTFMSADGPHHGSTMWAIIGMSSIISPIMMFLLRDFISPQENDELKDAAKLSRKRVNSRASFADISQAPSVVTPLVSTVTSARPPIWKPPATVDYDIGFADEITVPSQPK